ncbi:unnamed protein product [Discula destructiva]
MASPLPKVLLLGTIEAAHTEWAALAPLATPLRPTATTRAAFLDECASGALDGALVAYRTFDSVALTGAFDAELVAALPASLRFICHNGAGYDQICIPACTARGIRVSNVRSAVDDSTADTAVFLLLGALRNFGAGVESLRRGAWRGGGGGVVGGELALGREPRGLVLGVLGMGGIGRNLAGKMSGAFGMRLVYHNRTRLREELEGVATYVGFDELLAQSDVLSLHLPLNQHTHHIISHAQFARMKRGVVIINTARGAVMDEEALVAALASGQVGGAGLDVYEHEPAVHPALVADPRVLLVPHMGTYTAETTARMEAWTISNVRSVLEKGELVSVVPEQRDL